MLRSRRTRSGGRHAPSRCRAAVRGLLHLEPSSSRTRRIASRIVGWSSTIRMLAIVSAPQQSVGERPARNGRRSSAPSPTPTNRTGTPSSSRTPGRRRPSPTVHLGQHHARQLDRVGEGPRLRDPVLPGRRVQDQEGLVDLGAGLLDHPLHLGELVHQRSLGVETPGRVDDEHVGAAGGRRRHRVERHRAGSAPRCCETMCAPARWPRPRAAHRPRRGTCRSPPGSPMPSPPAASRACRSSWSCPIRSRRPPGSPRAPVGRSSASSSTEDGQDLGREHAAGSLPGSKSVLTRCTRSAEPRGPDVGLDQQLLQVVPRRSARRCRRAPGPWRPSPPSGYVAAERGLGGRARASLGRRDRASRSPTWPAPVSACGPRSRISRAPRPMHRNARTAKRPGCREDDDVPLHGRG